MVTKIRFYKSLARLFPRRYVNHLQRNLIYAGESYSVEQQLGKAVLLGLILFMAVLILPLSMFPPSDFSSGQSITFAVTAINQKMTNNVGHDYFSMFSLSHILFALLPVALLLILQYLHIYFKIEKRVHKVETYLPDMLQLISVNLRAGMTPFKAMQLTSTDANDPLSGQLNQAMTRAYGTGSFTSALTSVTSNFPSVLLKRVMKLISSSMRVGSHLSGLANDVGW